VSELELRVERLVAAPPERVFAHWTEPGLFAKWWGPEGFSMSAHAIDPRPGGHWRTTMRSPEGKLFTVSGVYRAVEPARRLVFTWGWEDDKGARGHETEVTVTFAAAPGGTKLVILQKEFATAEDRDRHGQGWNSTLNCLERMFA